MATLVLIVQILNAIGVVLVLIGGLIHAPKIHDAIVKLGEALEKVGK